MDKLIEKGLIRTYYYRRNAETLKIEIDPEVEIEDNINEENILLIKKILNYKESINSYGEDDFETKRRLCIHILREINGIQDDIVDLVKLYKSDMPYSLDVSDFRNSISQSILEIKLFLKSNLTSDYLFDTHILLSHYDILEEEFVEYVVPYESEKKNLIDYYRQYFKSILTFVDELDYTKIENMQSDKLIANTSDRESSNANAIDNIFSLDYYNDNNKKQYLNELRTIVDGFEKSVIEKFIKIFNELKAENFMDKKYKKIQQRFKEEEDFQIFCIMFSLFFLKQEFKVPSFIFELKNGTVSNFPKSVDLIYRKYVDSNRKLTKENFLYEILRRFDSLSNDSNEVIRDKMQKGFN